MLELKATLLDDDAFSVRAFPYTGPIPSPKWPGGIDLDGETFTHRTDIKPHWFKARPVDWMHGHDHTGVMGRTIIGKAINLREEDDGWWVDIWLDAGEERVSLIKKLAQRAAIYGSSEPIQDMVKVNKATGHIDVWPYLRQTLSTVVQNTHSVTAPLRKAVLDMHGVYSPTEAFWAEVLETLRDLGPDLLGAKAGQADDWSSVLDRTDVSVERLRALLTQRAKEGNDGGHP
jgi:hypothetical protein